jgi:DNA-binding transcriptional regulator LsrR (DeoR family)
MEVKNSIRNLLAAPPEAEFDAKLAAAAAAASAALDEVIKLSVNVVGSAGIGISKTVAAVVAGIKNDGKRDCIIIQMR